MSRRPTPAAIAAELLRHAVLLAGAAVMLAPFVVMLAISVKPPGEVFAPVFTLLPEQWHAWQNYRDAFTKVPLARFVLNGFLVTFAIFAVQAATALPMAYALAKLRWAGREASFLMVLAALLVPPQVPAIPLYIAFWQAGILDSYAAIILPSTISVFGIFLMRQFFRTVPDDLIAAARMDGMGEFAITWRIMLPTALPALAAFACLSFIWNWNEFFWPFIAIQSEHLATPPLGIAFFSNAEAGTNWGPLMAAATVVTLPLALAFLLAQRAFVQGVTMTGIK
jgi:multiple sugar transport system permease protein